MGEKSNLYHCDQKMLTYDAAVVLQQLVDGLKQGKLPAAGDSGPVCVEVPLIAKMEISFKEKNKPGKNKKKLSIEIAWKEGDLVGLE